MDCLTFTNFVYIENKKHREDAVFLWKKNYLFVFDLTERINFQKVQETKKH